MEQNFHYHVTYTAAVLAGFSPDDGQKIARAAQYVDECDGITVQSTGTLIWDNLLDTFPGNSQIRDVLKIWPVFHFLPGDVEAIRDYVNPQLWSSSRLEHQMAPKLICTPESRLVKETVETAKESYDRLSAPDGEEERLQCVGIAMHVLADTFAHQGFSGIPLACVNEVREVKEVKRDGTFGDKWYKIFEYSPALSDRSFGYLGHGRIGHIVDQPGACFAYQPAWKNPVGDSWTVRYNPLEFYCAFLQMREAMEYITGARPAFSNRLERGNMLNQRGTEWATTRKYLLALEKAGTDAGLPEHWYKVDDMPEPPPRYRPYSKSTEQNLIDSFQAAAQAHRQMVMELCTPLQECLELYPE